MNRARLLVVEDDIHLLQGIRDILEIEDYEVRTAGNGIEGLAVLKSMSVPPDLIISDIMMPRMDGYQFFEEVRKTPEWLDIPFVFLTAKGEKHDVRLGKRLGADDYVIKPMDPEDLLVIIDAKLRRHAQIKERYDGQVSEIKRSILTILNHEFRTPLTYMVAYSDMLNTDAENLTGEELRGFLQGVNSGAERFRRLVENFIALVELETGEARQNFEGRSAPMSDVRALCNEINAFCRPLLAERPLDLVFEVPDVVPVFVGDFDYLKVALQQLVENAVKFSADLAPGGKVVLRVTHDDQFLRFTVQDWGRGIAEDELERIWEPFYQIDRSMYEDQGAGSGLAIVAGIARLHGGHVDVVSKEGEGSTFTFNVPLKK